MSASENKYNTYIVKNNINGKEAYVNDLSLEQFLNLILYTTQNCYHNINITFPISDKNEVDDWCNKFNISDNKSINIIYI